MAISDFQAKQINNANEAMQRANVGTLLQEMEEELALLDPEAISNLASLAGELGDAINDPDTGLIATTTSLTSRVDDLSMQKIVHNVVAEDITEETTTVELACTGVPAGLVITVINDAGMVFGGYTVTPAEGTITVTGPANTVPVGSKITILVW